MVIQKRTSGANNTGKLTGVNKVVAVEEPEFLTPKQVAAKFSVKVATIREWVRRGQLKPIVLNPRVHRFNRTDVAKMVRDASI